MLKNTYSRHQSSVNSPQLGELSQQNGSFYVNYILDFKHFIDEMYNFKRT